MALGQHRSCQARGLLLRFSLALQLHSLGRKWSEIVEGRKCPAGVILLGGGILRIRSAGAVEGADNPVIAEEPRGHCNADAGDGSLSSCASIAAVLDANSPIDL